MARKQGYNNPRTPKTPQSLQDPWSAEIPPFGSIHPAPESAYDITGNQGDTQEAPLIKYPVSPPKSPSPKSPTPGSVVTAFTTQTEVAHNAATTKDVEAVNELLATMKLMLSALGSTLDTIGEQTMHVAALGPAIDANHQISTARKHLEDQHKNQEQRMIEVKTMLKNELDDGQLQEKLKETAGKIVKEIVRKEIAERVRKQLQEQIPQDMREQAARYKRQVMEVRASLHNSEARRHNALIRSNALDEPLRPLLRPFAKPLVSPRPRLTNNVASFPVTPQTAAAEPSDPTDPTSVPIIDINADPPKSAVPAPVDMDLVPPTPSPLFPRDLTGLMRLSPQEARSLVREYGLEPLRIPEEGSFGEGLETGNDEPQSTREENLNRFMSHIGVGFQLVPGPTSPRPVSPTSPAVATFVTK